MAVQDDLWKRVDELRGKVSVRELAVRMQVSEASLQSTRSLHTIPRIQMLYPLAKVLGTTIEYLYTGEKEDFEDTPVFRKIASDQNLFDIAEALCHADPAEIEMIRRILRIEKDGSVSTAGASA